MNLTSTHRRRARIGRDLFLSTSERHKAAMESLTKKRCAVYGVVYAPQNTDYYTNGEFGAYNDDLYRSHEECRRIRLGFRRLIPSDKFVNKVMERAGFKYLGNGSFRYCYEDRDGLVYKFFLSREYEARDDNRNDVTVSRLYHRNIDKAPADVRDKFYIPVMRMAYGVVIAEKVAPPSDANGGSVWGIEAPLDRFMRTLGWSVYDTHGGNMWWDGKRFVYVDLGHFRRVKV